MRTAPKSVLLLELGLLHLELGGGAAFVQLLGFELGLSHCELGGLTALFAGLLFGLGGFMTFVVFM